VSPFNISDEQIIQLSAILIALVVLPVPGSPKYTSNLVLIGFGEQLDNLISLIIPLNSADLHLSAISFAYG
jgi:hypothetical protein